MKSTKRNKDLYYTEVWGDTVVLKELLYACLIGVVLTMGMFLIGREFFSRMENLDKGLADGYALLVGVIGCILSDVISAKLFKPKRNIEERFESENIEDLLKAMGMTVEEEKEALSKLDPEIIKEMEELELYALLSLIPEDSQNYNPKYKEKGDGGV